jgi:transaldolase
MKYLIDTAKKREVDIWRDFVEGVTCNPDLLKKADIDVYDYCINNRYVFNNIFLQINSLAEAKELYDSFKNKIIFKVPLVLNDRYNGFILLKQLIKAGFRTCATIVYDIVQFDYACELGSEFSIILYAKNNNKYLIDECCELKQKRQYETKTIGASFRSTADVFNCIRCGTDYATVPPKIMEEIFTSPYALVDYNKFYGG